jgi:peptidoglycan-associated lipoprotein
MREVTMDTMTWRWRNACLVAGAALLLSACATPREETAATGDAGTAATPPAVTSRSDVASAAPSSSPQGSNAASASASSRAAPREMSVFFEFDSSTVSDQGRQVVTQHGDYLSADRRAIRLEGNADERGSREYNLALGQRRADTVRQMLVLRGLPADRVETVSNGEERPRCADHSEDCFAANRRVDFVYAR